MYQRPCYSQSLSLARCETKSRQSKYVNIYYKAQTHTHTHTHTLTYVYISYLYCLINVYIQINNRRLLGKGCMNQLMEARRYWRLVRQSTSLMWLLLRTFGRYHLYFLLSSFSSSFLHPLPSSLWPCLPVTCYPLPLLCFSLPSPPSPLSPLSPPLLSLPLSSLPSLPLPLFSPD